jgi:UDP-3-O-[3-hydroxymyristoyl] glucosamine N-acyltransferase
MAQGHTTGSLAKLLGARLEGPADLPIRALDGICSAGPGALTFIRCGKYAARWAASGATAALVSEGIKVDGHDPSARALLRVPDADRALIAVLELFAPRPRPPEPLLHAAASIDPDATVAPTAHVGPGCVVARGASVGDGAVLIANVTIGPDASVGRGCTLHPGVAVMDRCVVGDGCTIHAGAVIGADGFGYRPAPGGNGLVKIPHIGAVRIGNGVEIGANTCIDRAKFGQTVVGDGTKIDNLVQIGHNCVIGRACVICGMSGLAGSVTLGDGVVLGGGVRVADNLTIGAGARVGGGSGVMHDIPEGQTWLGAPATPYREQVRLITALKKLARGGAVRNNPPA